MTHSRTKRYWTDRFVRLVVLTGGLGVLAAVSLMLFYLAWVAMPLFEGASIEEYGSSDLPDRPIHVSFASGSDYLRIVSADGEVRYLSTADGSIAHTVRMPELSSWHEIADSSGLNVIRTARGELQVVALQEARSYGTQGELDVSVTNHTLDIDATRIQDSSAIVAMEQRRGLLLAAASDRGIDFWLLDPRRRYAIIDESHLSLPGDRWRLQPGATGRQLYAIDQSGQVFVVDTRDPTMPRVLTKAQTITAGESLQASTILSGASSLLIAGTDDRLTQWFLVQGASAPYLAEVRTFELDLSPTELASETNRKVFIAASRSGEARLVHASTGNVLHEFRLAEPGGKLVLSQRSEVLSQTFADRVHIYRLNNPHPEVGWSALFQRIWYEGYEHPDWIWQSSSAQSTFEPKFSLVPLLVGTLKASLYAMLIATPLALLAAIYTSTFASSAVRNWVKPTLETMSAIPTVVLGFLGGLWLAPMIEQNLAATLAFVPASLTITLAWYWAASRANSDVLQHPLCLVMVMGISASLVVWIAPTAEHWLLGRELRSWMETEAGIDYAARNALVVGIAMAFALVPTIYTIADDALAGVPRHLVDGSLALGASRWQTLTQVTLLIASPGLFSAVIIGFGRAVGETMIVLMATGNTPIVEWNVFEGMRTLAANIAIEMPESEVGSSHYRILYLTALLLFILTFIANSAADLIRQRLVERFGTM